MVSFDFIISSMHPCLEGHFPNNPIVPGVVIIDEIMQQVCINEPTIKITNIPSVKFLKPLKADTVVNVTVSEKNSGLYQFSCHIKEDLIVSGQLRIQVKKYK